MAEADAGETVVSSTVKDLVVGSGIAFEDRGEHQLKASPEPGGSSPYQVPSKMPEASVAARRRETTARSDPDFMGMANDRSRWPEKRGCQGPGAGRAKRTVVHRQQSVPVST
jgi:hypothetical protein